ncbi:MAG: WG repeat-containing protein [Bacteroidetes bacterium]|nr:MAG: WG repeat-containing protein [Bacteroidota bacterium]
MQKYFISFCLLIFFVSVANAQVFEITDSVFYEENKTIKEVRVVKVKDLYGLVNDTGKILLPTQYTSIEFLGKNDSTCKAWHGIAKVEQNGQFGLINANGSGITALIYEEIEFWQNTCQSEDFESKVLKIRQYGKYGLTDSKGNIFIRPSYDRIDLLTDSEGKISTPAVVRVLKSGKFGFLELKTKNILPSQYEEISFLQQFQATKKTKAFCVLKIKSKGKYAVKNPQDADEIKFDYDQIFTFDSLSQMALVKIKNNFGYINIKGKLEIKAEYSEASLFRNGIAIVKKNNKTLLINAKEKVLASNYENLVFLIETKDFSKSNPKYHELILAKKDGKLGLLDSEGKTIFPCEYEVLDFQIENDTFKSTKNGDQKILRWK